MQSRSFGSGPCRQAFPVGRAPRLGDVGSRAGNRPTLTPGSKYMRAADPEYIRLGQGIAQDRLVKEPGQAEGASNKECGQRLGDADP